MKNILKQRTPIKYLEKIFENNLKQDFDLIWNSKNSNLLSVSDYSGDRPCDNYSVYSFLLVDKMEAPLFLVDMINLRRNEPYLNPKSYFEFKKIEGDNVRTRLFHTFLSKLEKVKGALIVFLIQKDFDWLKLSDRNLSQYLIEENLGSWASHVLKNKIETLILNGFLISKLDSKFEDITWLTDRDARIGSNSDLINYTEKILKKVFNLFELKYKNIYLHIQNKVVL